MKKGLMVALAAIAVTVSVAGCGGDGKLSNDYVTVNQYKVRWWLPEQNAMSMITDFFMRRLCRWMDWWRALGLPIWISAVLH